MTRPLHLPGLVAIALALATTACDSTDPFTSGPGHASVHGFVTDATGAPVPGTAVRIACLGAATVTIPTDSLGSYAASLSLPAAWFKATDGEPSCHFSEPAAGAALVQLDTTLGFARGPTLVPLQIINLRRP